MKTKSKTSGYIFRSAAYAALLLCLIVGFSSAFNLPGKWSALSRVILPGGMTEPATQTKTLTFADRVAYQRAIEEIYWRHRTWSGENDGTEKPALDKVMSQAQIETKVENYLRNSQALENYWQKPITPEQLQSEMDRMARHTRQPEVLREIFAALGNDPYIIAECLARPALADRLARNLYAHDERFHGELKRRAEAELQAHPSIEQLKQTLPAAASRSDAGAASGTYSEIEWAKSDDQSNGRIDNPIVGQPPRLPSQASAGEAPAQPQQASNAVKLDSTEWNDSLQKLAAIFGDGHPVVAGVPPAQPTRLPLQETGMARPKPVLSKVEGGALETRDHRTDRDPLSQIPTAVLSPLQEDDDHYYAAAVISKGKDRLKLATVAWMKQPFDSWRAKAETQMPVTMAAQITADYRLPVIGNPSVPSVQCTVDTWTATALGAPEARYYHTAVWTGSEMIVWGGSAGF